MADSIASSRGEDTEEILLEAPSEMENQVHGDGDQVQGAGDQAQGAGQPDQRAAHLGLEAGYPAQVVRQKARGFRQLGREPYTRQRNEPDTHCKGLDTWSKESDYRRK